MSEDREIAFHIRDLPIRGRVFLSPMANFSDSPYRFLCRQMGAAFSYTEFVSADGLVAGDKDFLDMLRFDERERPIIFQIFGNTEENLVRAAQIAIRRNPDVIDLNMGCSVKQISHKGAGAGLLREPIKAGRIIESLVKTLPIPVTAKIRLGWDDTNRNYLEVAHILQESGISMLSVHGRTKQQAYSGVADWTAIAEVKNHVSVPVLGSGDVTDHQDALDKIQVWGVDGVLVGRNAIGNPWLFSGRDKRSISLGEILQTMLHHFNEMIKYHGEKGFLHFRKHVAGYLKSCDPNLRLTLQTCDTEKVFLEVLERALKNETTMSMSV